MSREDKDSKIAKLIDLYQKTYLHDKDIDKKIESFFYEDDDFINSLIDSLTQNTPTSTGYALPVDKTTYENISDHFERRIKGKLDNTLKVEVTFDVIKKSALDSASTEFPENSNFEKLLLDDIPAHAISLIAKNNEADERNIISFNAFSSPEARQANLEQDLIPYIYPQNEDPIMILSPIRYGGHFISVSILINQKEKTAKIKLTNSISNGGDCGFKKYHLNQIKEQIAKKFGISNITYIETPEHHKISQNGVDCGFHSILNSLIDSIILDEYPGIKKETINTLIDKVCELMMIEKSDTHHNKATLRGSDSYENFIVNLQKVYNTYPRTKWLKISNFIGKVHSEISKNMNSAGTVHEFLRSEEVSIEGQLEATRRGRKDAAIQSAIDLLENNKLENINQQQRNKLVAFLKESLTKNDSLTISLQSSANPYLEISLPAQPNQIASKEEINELFRPNIRNAEFEKFLNTIANNKKPISESLGEEIIQGILSNPSLYGFQNYSTPQPKSPQPPVSIPAPVADDPATDTFTTSTQPPLNTTSKQETKSPPPTLSTTPAPAPSPKPKPEQESTQLKNAQSENLSEIAEIIKEEENPKEASQKINEVISKEPIEKFANPEAYCGIGAKTDMIFDDENKTYNFKITEIFPNSILAQKNLKIGYVIKINSVDNNEESQKSAIQTLRNLAISPTNENIEFFDEKGNKIDPKPELTTNNNFVLNKNCQDYQNFKKELLSRNPKEKGATLGI